MRTSLVDIGALGLTSISVISAIQIIPTVIGSLAGFMAIVYYVVKLYDHFKRGTPLD